MKSSGWSYLTLAVMTWLGLAGCGKEPGKPAGVELVLLTPGGQIAQALQKSLAAFRQEHPQITVRTISSPGKDYYTKGLTLLAGRARLDLLWLGMGFGMFADRGALLDLAPYAERDVSFSLETLTPEVVAWYRHGEALLGLPYGVDVQAIVCNDSLLEALGLPLPDATWSVDEMVALGRAAKKASTPQRPIPYGIGMEELRPYLFGLSLLKEGGRRFGLATSEGEAWLTLNTELARERVLLRSAGPGDLDRMNEFFAQRVALMEIFTWDLPALQERAAFRWRVLPPPRGPKGERGAWASSSGFSVTRHTSHPEEAWLLLRHLVASGFQKELLDRTLPTARSLYDAYIAQGGEHAKDYAVFVSLLPVLRPDPRIARQDELLAEWVYWRESAHQGQRSVPDALAQAEARIHRLLGRGKQDAQP